MHRREVFDVDTRSFGRGFYIPMCVCFVVGCTCGGLFGPDVPFRNGFWECMTDGPLMLLCCAVCGLFYFGQFLLPGGLWFCGLHTGICLKATLSVSAGYGVIPILIPMASYLGLGLVLCGLAAEAMAISGRLRRGQLTGDDVAVYGIRATELVLLGAVHVLAVVYIFRLFVDLFETSLEFA